MAQFCTKHTQLRVGDGNGCQRFIGTATPRQWHRTRSQCDFDGLATVCTPTPPRLAQGYGKHPNRVPLHILCKLIFAVVGSEMNKSRFCPFWRHFDLKKSQLCTCAKRMQQGARNGQIQTQCGKSQPMVWRLSVPKNDTDTGAMAERLAQVENGSIVSIWSIIQKKRIKMWEILAHIKQMLYLCTVEPITHAKMTRTEILQAVPMNPMQRMEPTMPTPRAVDLRGLVAQFVAMVPNIKASTRKQYTRDLSQFFAWVENSGRAFSALTQLDVVTFQTELENKGLSPLTISGYLTSVRLFFEWADANKIYNNIAKGVRGPQRKKKFQKQALLNDQATTLLQYAKEHCTPRDFAIVNLALRCGLRTIEIVRANVGDIAFKGGRRVLKVWGKGKVLGDKEEDFVVLSDKAFQPIADYLQTRPTAQPDEPLFVTNYGRKRAEIENQPTNATDGTKHGERLTTRMISKICKDALVGIGLTGHEYTAHSLRHTCGCSIIRQHGSLQDVQFVLRHASSKTSEIYLESIKEEQRLERAPELLLDNAF